MGCNLASWSHVALYTCVLVCWMWVSYDDILDNNLYGLSVNFW